MKKSLFTKYQILGITDILKRESMLPCDNVFLFSDDPSYEWKNCVAYKALFVKGDKECHFVLAAPRKPNIKELTDQLNEYFVKGKND